MTTRISKAAATIQLQATKAEYREEVKAKVRGFHAEAEAMLDKRVAEFQKTAAVNPIQAMEWHGRAVVEAASRFEVARDAKRTFEAGPTPAEQETVEDALARLIETARDALYEHARFGRASSTCGYVRAIEDTSHDAKGRKWAEILATTERMRNKLASLPGD